MNTLKNNQNLNTAHSHVDSIQIDAIDIRRDQDGRYCINDLHKASGGLEKYQPNFYLRNKQTKDLIKAIDSLKNDHSANLQSAVKVINGGHERGTYVVKELVYAYAMWISAVFHLKVIRVFDAVIQNQQPQIPNFNDPVAAARAWANEMEAKQIAQRQLEIAAPKINHYDTVVNRCTLLNASQVAQKLGMSAKKLNCELEVLDVYNKSIKRGRVFHQWFIDEGLGQLKQVESGHS